MSNTGLNTQHHYAPPIQASVSGQPQPSRKYEPDQISLQATPPEYGIKAPPPHSPSKHPTLLSVTPPPLPRADYLGGVPGYILWTSHHPPPVQVPNFNPEKGWVPCRLNGLRLTPLRAQQIQEFFTKFLDLHIQLYGLLKHSVGLDEKEDQRVEAYHCTSNPSNARTLRARYLKAAQQSNNKQAIDCTLVCLQKIQKLCKNIKVEEMVAPENLHHHAPEMASFMKYIRSVWLPSAEFPGGWIQQQFSLCINGPAAKRKDLFALKSDLQNLLHMLANSIRILEQVGYPREVLQLINKGIKLTWDLDIKLDLPE